MHGLWYPTDSRQRLVHVCNGRLLGGLLGGKVSAAPPFREGPLVLLSLLQHTGLTDTKSRLAELVFQRLEPAGRSFLTQFIRRSHCLEAHPAKRPRSHMLFALIHQHLPDTVVARVLDANRPE